MIKLLGIFDPHLSAHTPPSFKVDYLELSFATMRRVLRFAEKQQVDAIVCAGDLFHRKAPHQNPHWFIAEVIRLLKEAPCPIIGIAGNHDVKYGTFETGLRGQPLELVIEAGAYELLDNNAMWFEGPLKGGPSVKVTGDSYHHAQAERSRQHKKEGADWLVNVCHVWFGPVSGNFFGEPVYGPDFFQDSEVDVYMIGHHHADQGIQTINGKTYDSHGSISKTGAHEHDRTRRPAVSLLEFSKTEVKTTIVRPKYPDAADMLDLDRLQELKEEREELDNFARDLATTAIDSKDPDKILEELQLPQKVKERTKEYLEAAETP